MHNLKNGKNVKKHDGDDRDGDDDNINNNKDHIIYHISMLRMVKSSLLRIALGTPLAIDDTFSLI